MRVGAGKAVLLARRHWLFLAVMAAAVLVRVLVEIPFWPALIYIGDSFGYLKEAIQNEWGQTQPNGYPAILALLFLPGRELGTITIVQHLAGLAVGTLTYATLLRLGVNRYVAALPTALVLLDSFAVVLEQHILTETFFALELMAGVFLTVTGTGRRRTAAAGLLFAAAAVTRVVGLVAVPVWLAYVAAKTRAARTFALAAVVAVTPLAAYAGIHAAAHRGFRFTEWNGWILYGRVAHFADCRGVSLTPAERRVCETPAQRRLHVGWTPSEYIFRSDSPAWAAYGPSSRDPRVNSILLGFALRMILAHPGAYAHDVLVDYSRYFRPGSFGQDPAVFLHEQYEPDLSRYTADPVMRRYFPGFTLRFGGPLYAAVWYSRHLRPPRLLYAFLALAILAAFVLGLSRRARARLPHWLEMTFLGALAFVLSFVAVATTEFNLRFFIPVVPLLACSATLALWELGVAVAKRRRSSVESAETAARLG